MQIFKSNAKLLLTGEYAVLDGAKSLALPLKRSQSLEAQATGRDHLDWTSLDEKNQIWFSGKFEKSDGKFVARLNKAQQKDSEIKEIAKRLEQIFNFISHKYPGSLKGGLKITTRMDFDRKWGLGTSSSLINNIAQWLNIDAFELQENTFGGSGYDIAAAMNNNPITYQRTPNGPAVFAADFNPSFKDQLFFVYLNRKQNSREAIAHYKNQPREKIKGFTEKISGITEQILSCENLEEFKLLLEAHEAIISKAINLKKIKAQLFPDYSGLIKSLGGWGGDFVLATGGEEEKNYFRTRGHQTLFDYSEIIL